MLKIISEKILLFFQTICSYYKFILVYLNYISLQGKDFKQLIYANEAQLT